MREISRRPACMEDVFRLGSTHIPDRTAITCLQEKEAGTVQVFDGSEVLLCMPEPKAAMC